MLLAAAQMTQPPRTSRRRWLRLRNAYLARNPLCECGCGQPSVIVDHRQPHNGDEALMYDWDNLQALTKPCFDSKAAADAVAPVA